MVETTYNSTPLMVYLERHSNNTSLLIKYLTSLANCITAKILLLINIACLNCCIVVILF
ncbi:hypothetical protein D3C72_927430 [compost metagenome]